MKNLIIAMAISVTGILSAEAQTKYFTREGTVQFLSKAPMEEIEAVNKKATSVLDTETGQMEFSVLMKAFEFEKALMQEHFNENYVESSKFPKAVFKGKIDNASEVNWNTDGTYPVKVSGQMTLHGVTKDVTADGTMKVENGKLIGMSTFLLPLKDYNIEIPKVVKDKVSEQVKVTVNVNYEALKAN
jgi:polyisoprenoid-binding protein YceI